MKLDDAAKSNAGGNAGDVVGTLIPLIGKELTLALIKAAGGVRFRIPVKPFQKSSLVQAVGMEAAEKMAAIWGGQEIKIPVARQWRTIAYREQGKTYSEIARLVGLTESGVGKTLRAAGMTNAAAPMHVRSQPALPSTSQEPETCL